MVQFTMMYVQVVWQAFHAFYHSFNKLSWQWKTCQTNLAEFCMFTNISFRNSDFIQFLGQTCKGETFS